MEFYWFQILNFQNGYSQLHFEHNVRRYTGPNVLPSIFFGDTTSLPFMAQFGQNYFIWMRRLTRPMYALRIHTANGLPPLQRVVGFIPFHSTLAHWYASPTHMQGHSSLPVPCPLSRLRGTEMGQTTKICHSGKILSGFNSTRLQWILGPPIALLVPSPPIYTRRLVSYGTSCTPSRPPTNSPDYLDMLPTSPHPIQRFSNRHQGQKHGHHSQYHKILY